MKPTANVLSLDDLPASHKILWDSYRVESQGLVTDVELAWLTYLIHIHRPEAFMEIGCRDGSTTQRLATVFPHIEFYAVDCVKAISPINRYQQNETPSWETVCYKARDMANVTYINCDTQGRGFFVPAAVEMVFIDGDHTLSGVLNDIKKCKGRLCILHDAIPNENYPWIAVDFAIKDLQPTYIKDTRLAYIK